MLPLVRAHVEVVEPWSVDLADIADPRQGGEEGLRYNLMIPAAVRRSGGEEVGSLDELDAALHRRAA